MEILHLQNLGDTRVVSECSLGVNLVIDKFCYVASGISPLYKIWKQSDYYLRAILTKATRSFRRVLSVHSHISRKTLDATGILVMW